MAMRELPILFSGAMIKAILSGAKSVTRRVIKPPRCATLHGREPLPDKSFPDDGYFHYAYGGGDLGGDFCSKRVFCPYGSPGGKLWVRETHAIVPRTAYAASTDDGETQLPHQLSPCGNDWAIYREGWTRCIPSRWRPSIHMPRWASRITLEVTGVRCERLQEITAADILAEGAVTRPHVVEGLSGKCPVSAFDGAVYPDLRSLWVKGWDSINAKRGFGWASNPWVWAVDFRRVE